MCPSGDEQLSWCDWNVLRARWLDVTPVGGKSMRCSPLEAMARAAKLREVEAASPLDVFAAYRFLLTLLYWKADACGGVAELRDCLLAGSVPPPVYEAIAAEADEFFLFDTERPFLQDTTLSEKAKKKAETKSAGSFFMEFACGTNLAHFHHGDDAATRLCLRCTTVGMMRVIPWTQSGGSGLTPSIHGAPPIMALALGENLAMTLGLNLVPFPENAPRGEAKWHGAFEPSYHGKDVSQWGPIAYLEAMTWNPRRIWLPEPESGHACWRCGQVGPSVYTIGQVVFAKNDGTKKPQKDHVFAWRDPAAFYPAIGLPKTKKEKRDVLTNRKSGNENVAFKERDCRCLFDEKSASSSAVQRANPDHHDWMCVIPCTNPANNKTYDVRSVRVGELTAEAFEEARVHVPEPVARGKLPGWSAMGNCPRRSRHFVLAACRRFTVDDWACVAAARHRRMHEMPGAFDLFSGLWWHLRRKNVPLPKRHVAWLILKLMGSVPPVFREVPPDGGWNPLREIDAFQLPAASQARPHALQRYPRALPDIRRLEMELEALLRKNAKRRVPRPVGWDVLADQLGALLK